MAEHISMNLDTILRNIKSMTASLTELPDDAEIARVSGLPAFRAGAGYHEDLARTAGQLSEDADSLRTRLVGIVDAIVATAADMAKVDESIADEVRALREAFGGLAATDTPAADTPATADVPVLPSKTDTLR